MLLTVTRFRSIGFLLSALTGLTVALLVSVFSLVAKDAYDKQQATSHLLSDIGALQNILNAQELTLLIQSQIRVKAADGAAGTKSLQQMAQLRSSLDAAVDASTNLAEPRQDLVSSTAKVRQNYAVLQKNWTDILGTLTDSDPTRRAGLNNDSGPLRMNFTDALKDHATILANDLDSSDPFISEMMKIKNIALKMREDAGTGRGIIMRILSAGTKPEPAQLAQIAEMDGRISAPWGVIMADLRLPLVPLEMRQVINRTNQIYFDGYRNLRQKIIDGLSADTPSRMSSADWLAQTDGPMESITQVAATALNLSYTRVSGQLAEAQTKLYIAVGLMILSIALAALTTIVVVGRVIRPLSAIAKAMETVAEGDLQHKIPYKNRQDEIGRFARALKTFRDNAREKQQMESELLQNQMARETAEASNRIKSEFLANMSHELRTPLNAVIGFSDIMKQKLFGPLNKQYDEYAGLIHESGQLLLNLVSDILDIAKIEAGKFTLDLQNVDLADAVNSCSRLVKRRADERHISLNVVLPPEPLTFVADARAFKQILLNLLSNAIKFSCDGGKVSIVGEAGPESLKVTVRDNGIGIPASMLSRIGHAFEQVNNDPTRSREGTGLGLALVRSLVSEHGGKFAIDSIEHVGTTVIIELPLLQKARLAA